MRDLVDEIQVLNVKAHYNFAAAGRCGSRDHRAEMKRVKLSTKSSMEYRSIGRTIVSVMRSLPKLSEHG